MTTPAQLRVFARIVRPTPKLAAICAEHYLECSQIMLVCATTANPDRINKAAQRYGVALPKTKLDELGQMYADYITDFAKENPNILFARPGTGKHVQVTDPDTGETFTPWAELGAI